MNIEHPLITVDPGSTMEQLQSRIQELTKKMNTARRLGNAHLANQISMALYSYQSVYDQRLREQQQRDSRNAPDYSDRIDIS